MLSLVRSIKKSYRIRKVSQNYMKYNYEIGFTSELIEEKEKAINQILELSFNESLNQEIIRLYKIDFDGLKEKFLLLERVGCGQVVRGHYVSISCLMFPQTLAYIFKQKIITRDECEKVAFDLIDWFEKGKSETLN